MLLRLRALARASAELAEAEVAVGDERAHAELAGERPLVAHCHLGLGKLHRRTAKLEGARDDLTTATAMYREMDMRFWLEQADAELARL